MSEVAGSYVILVPIKFVFCGLMHLMDSYFLQALAQVGRLFYIDFESNCRLLFQIYHVG